MAFHGMEDQTPEQHAELSRGLQRTIRPELEIRQAPLPKADDPYEWTGWPLFEQYGLTGSGGPSKRWTRTVTLPGDSVDG